MENDILISKTIHNLNKAQKQAIETYDCPLLILAGAGTGKTTTITARIANLILKDVAKSENILAVTFTNKAAGEMKNRIEKFTDNNAGKMWIGTFHGVSARILRIHAKALGLEPNFLILDDYDHKKLITQVMKDLNIDEKQFPSKAIQFIISSLKEKCVDHNDVEKISTFKYKDLDITKIYQTYQLRLRGMNAVDFDDLIFESVKLFKHEPKILSDLQNRFQYITVDEYQDTNELQHLWLRLLVGGNPNICCVGDEDQSIYGWRGAKVDYILSFGDDFLGAKIIRLEQNYRSVQPILDAAMSVISNNKQRYKKTLTSGINSGHKPNLVLVESDKDENANIAKNIIALQRNGVEYKDMAILVRTTHQIRSIEDCFIKNDIPYKIIGGIKFYDRKEIKDLIAYIRFTYSLTDIISLERIINVPKRGIGEKSFSDIKSYIEKNNYKLFEGIKNIVSFGNNILNQKTSVAIKDFIDFTENIHNFFFKSSGNNSATNNDKNTMQLCDIIDKIYFDSGYAQMLQDELVNDPEVSSKIENIREFISSTKQFANIDEFLEHISLVSANDGDENSLLDSVNMMTMHAAKGLEFSYVFLPAWEDEIFPSQKSINENGCLGLEEERRLAYVALTRAKQNFYIYSAKQRMVFGKLQLCKPSCFINEMKDKLQIIDLTYNHRYHSSITANSSTNKYVNNNNAYSKNDNYFNNDNDRKKYHGNNNNHIGSKSNYYDYENNFNTEKYEKYTNRNDFLKKSYRDFDSFDLRQSNSYAEAEQKEKMFSIGDKVFSEKFGYGVVRNIYGKFYEIQFKNTRQITKDVIKASADDNTDSGN